MRLRYVFLASISLVCCSTNAMATEGDTFAGLDFSIGTVHGSSRTTNGGAPFAGGGVVTDVKFGGSRTIGGHVGYRVNSALSAFISYQHSRSDLSWNVNYPLFAVSSTFEGSATSHTVTGNLAYEIPVSRAVAVRVTAGAGLAFNRLSGITETDEGTGLFLADVANHTRTSLAAQAGFGLRYTIAPNIALGLNGAFSYAGGFETGNTRSGNLGITAINPYKIDDVWRTHIGASVTFGF